MFINERKNYPVLAKTAYLDNPSSGLIPSYAADAMKKYLDDRCENAMDGKKYFQNWDFLDELRVKCGALLHCAPEEIAFGESASALFNIFSNGIPLQAGDNVVCYSSAWPAVTYSWLNKKKGGIELRIIDPEDGRVEAERLIDQADEKTKAICVCHVDFHTGYKHDLERLGTFCRERGIFFAVDATQSCGVMDIDVKKMKVDFLCTSSYKWLQGALGIGFAFIDEALLSKLHQADVGWVGTEDRQKNNALELALSKDAKRFEYGGQSVIAAYGLNETISNYLRLGGSEINSYVLSLVNEIYELVNKTPDLRVYGNFEEKNRSNIVCICYPDRWTHITTEYLQNNGVAALVIKPGIIRIGVHYFNRLSDVEKLINLLNGAGNL